MKRAGNYCRVEDDFEIDHEINLEVDRVKEQIKDIESLNTHYLNKAKIKKALIETILESI